MFLNDNSYLYRGSGGERAIKKYVVVFKSCIDNPLLLIYNRRRRDNGKALSLLLLRISRQKLLWKLWAHVSLTSILRVCPEIAIMEETKSLTRFLNPFLEVWIGYGFYYIQTHTYSCTFLSNLL